MSPGLTEMVGAVAIIGIIMGSFVVWAWIDKRGPHIFTRETPLQVLQRRLAEGEITPDEFDELRRRIER